nr:hypothetical protein CFP56_51390 [Quercus suber]
MRALVYIMIFNFYPMKNLTTLSQPMALFLYDLYKKKEINICANIYHLLAWCVNKKKSQMTLPFSGLIMSILHLESVKSPSSLLVMKREDPISTQTMMRSKACLLGTKGEPEEEGAQGEDTTAEGGNTDEEIDNFTLGPDDMQASPLQAQPQE